jgi:hypothetical protein
VAEELAHVDDIDAVLRPTVATYASSRAVEIRKVLICACPKGLCGIVLLRVA